MFFTTAPAAFQSSVCRPAFAHGGRAVERFLNDALLSARHSGATYTQDDTSFTLSLDVPGIAKQHLRIAIDGAVIRIHSKDDAPRRYHAAYEFPQEVDSAQSEATLDNGVLTLKLAKKVPVDTSAELPIQ
ncbi:MAG: Hsp20/alpha crystallin family protein [Rhodoferax sp.]|nr:Hsp20/alpha crystallin family protein [Rhodoferax sp.]